MSNKQTKTRNYPSKYSQNTWITAAQYMGEIMCERRAISLKRDLPNNFWNLPEWKKYYCYQVYLANQLLKKHTAEEIINTLTRADFKFIYSLKFKKFVNAIKSYNAILVEVAEREEHAGEFKREPQKKNSTIEKLKELDE